MIIHKLKTTNPGFNDVWTTHKRFDVRLNDRNYQIGDFLLLREYDPNTSNEYLKRELLCKVIYIFTNKNFLQENYIILGIIIIEKLYIK